MMTILLSDLVERLMADAPSEDGVPSAAQYERAVRDAVRDFSERCGLEQIGTLNITPGTATYELPADFLKLIELESFASADGVLITGEGIIPVSATWAERWTIRNGQITFSPAPTYTMARELRYKAAWVATLIDPDYADYEYEQMGEREARIVLLKAQSEALNKQVNAASGQVLKYSLGAVSVDKGGSVEGKRTKAGLLDQEYIEACEIYNGPRMAAG